MSDKWRDWDEQIDQDHKADTISGSRRVLLVLLLVCTLLLFALSMLVFSYPPSLGVYLILYSSIGLILVSIVLYGLIRKSKGSTEMALTIFTFAFLNMLPPALGQWFPILWYTGLLFTLIEMAVVIYYIVLVANNNVRRIRKPGYF